MPGVNDVLGPLPEGYAAAPLFRAQDHSPLRLCVVIGRTADPVSGHLVLLRELFDARVLLGAVTDAAGTVHQYVEIWVQTLQGIRQTGERLGLSNQSLDDRWMLRFQACAAADPGSVISTGFESVHPAPTLIDTSSLQPVGLPGATDGEWQLCKDEGLLAQVGLPAYNTSLDRYLYQPKLGKAGPFAAVTPGSPTGQSTVPLADLLAQAPTLAAVNAACGLLLVRPYQPLSFEEFLDILRSGSWDGVRHGRSILQWTGPGGSNGQASAEPLGGQQLLSRYGRAGKAIERFYLTICALGNATASVRDVVEQSQRPCLNLTADSFRVGLCQPGPGLPLLWTARVALWDLGDALPLNVEGTETQYFVRAASGASSIYQPSLAQAASSGRGSFRIRQILPEGRGIVVEGTFTPRERLTAARNDLLRLRVGVAAGRVDLYARLQPDMALAGGEWRVRSLPQMIADPLAAQLRAAAGSSLTNIEFEQIAFQSTPCDEYALAVLAVHALLVKPGGNSAVALDEVMSLARQAAIEAPSGEPLSQRIAGIFNKDTRWSESLGPGPLWGEAGAIDPRRWLIPAELWWEALSTIVRLLPGIGPDSYSIDYGDAPPGAIHRVFEQPLADWDALINKTRSLVLGDWQLNREVHGVIGWFLEAPKDTKKPVAGARPASRSC